MQMQEFAPGLFTLWHPLRVLGMDYGTRTTIVRLAPGRLALISPGNITDEQAREVEALGEVELLVGPSLLHHLFLGHARERWPRAQIWAPRGLARKRPDLRIDAELAEKGELGPDVSWLRVEGMPLLREHVFFYRPAGVLVLQDMCFNFRDHPQAWLRMVMRLNGSYGRLAPSHLLRSAVRQPEATRRSLEAILAWPWDAITLAHGEQVAQGAREQFLAGWRYLLGPAKPG